VYAVRAVQFCVLGLNNVVGLKIFGLPIFNVLNLYFFRISLNVIKSKRISLLCLTLKYPDINTSWTLSRQLVAADEDELRCVNDEFCQVWMQFEINCTHNCHSSKLI